MTLPDKVKDCIRKNNYEVIVRFEPQPPVVTIQKGMGNHTASSTICTLTFELQEEGNNRLSIDCKEVLDKTIVLYALEQYFEIINGNGKLRFNEAFKDLAGASRYNL